LTSEPIIAARGVTRRFGGLVALDNVDLDVPCGIVQAIIGPNGSGKTTLLNALSGASHADAGSIRIGGNEIFRLKPHRIARLGLARTFQTIRIFENLSVIENVKVAAACHTPTSLFNIVTSNARQQQSEAEINNSSREALEIVGLSDRAEHTPNQLSGGQQQRVAIARALSNQPSLVLADEPTGNLDSRTSIEIMGVFQKLNEQGITIVMVTHELDIAQYTKRMVVMRDGKVVSDTPVPKRLNAENESRRLQEEQKAVQLAD